MGLSVKLVDTPAWKARKNKKFGLWQVQRLEGIQTDYPFRPLTQEDKTDPTCPMNKVYMVNLLVMGLQMEICSSFFCLGQLW